MSDLMLDLRRSFAHQGVAKILPMAMGKPAVIAKLYPTRSRHIASPKIAQLNSGLRKN
jgi:hypothetical protein